MIRRLYLRNWGPFRGEHTIDLGAYAYAVVARQEGDSTRSNGIGKSALFEAIDFAVTGRLNKKRGYDADGWITRGEREGCVAVVLDDGAHIERSRVRGKPTQVRFKAPDFDEAAQEQASVGILGHLGFTADDFRSAAYLEQREMARLIHADPSERLGIVSGWLGLLAADRAEQLASDKASEIGRSIEPTIARVRLLREQNAAPLAIPNVDDVVQMETKLRACESSIEHLTAQKAIVREADKARIVLAAHEQRIEEGKAARARLDALEGAAERAKAAEAEITALAGETAKARENMGRKRQVSLGVFDGACPVAPITCPAKDKINADRDMAKRALDEAKKEHDITAAAEARAREVHAPTFKAARDYEHAKGEVERMREQIRARIEDVKAARLTIEQAPTAIGDIPEIDEQIKKLTAEREEYRIALRMHDHQLSQRTESAQQIDALEKGLSADTIVQRRYLKAASIFRTAQRRVAERALARVETDANNLLASAGSDLTISARWEREGRGLAKSCEECGAAFPASAKVKICETCGTPRAQKTVQRLDFVLPNHSGALDDLAGIAMQISAGSWLLASRHSPWATALIDEPFGACDKANRTGLAVALSKVFSASAFRQSLIVSHTLDTVEMLAHRIEITARKNGDRAITVIG